MEDKSPKPVVPATPTPIAPVVPAAPEVPPVSEPVVEKDDEDIKVGWDSLHEGYLTSPAFYEVANYFGIEQADYATAKDKLSDIVDYIVHSKKSPKIEDILVGIRELEDQVQPPAWGEKRYTNVYRYVRLAGKRLALDQAMSAFEKKKD